MLKEGLEIREYTLNRFLGKGSFGEVWLAEKKIEIADKKVPFALKFISGSVYDVSDYSNVKREINTWIDASGHKNIISVLDGFVYENMFVIVSEYANSGSLRHWLRTQGGKVAGLEQTVEIMCGVLDGLTHLHSQNIIHRDLKPENVLLKGDVPCIADFGVSRIVETVSLEMSSGTNTAGSPLYMSPESFERIKPTPQIDIWSAGVMLFEMLSGRTPYASDTIPGLIYEIVTKEPRSLPAEIPQSFHRVIKKALAKDVSQRFTTAKEMREALMRALYSQHTDTSDAIPVESPGAETVKNDSQIHLLETQPMTREISAAEIKQSRKKSVSVAFLGIGAIAFLAAIFGIYTFTKSSAETNANQADSISNQSIVVETNTNNNANSIGNISNTANVEVTAKPPINEKPVEKTVEKANRENPPADKKIAATKVETPVKKDAAKKNQSEKKKVDLDDLIN